MALPLDTLLPALRGAPSQAADRAWAVLDDAGLGADPVQASQVWADWLAQWGPLLLGASAALARLAWAREVLAEHRTWRALLTRQAARMTDALDLAKEMGSPAEEADLLLRISRSAQGAAALYTSERAAERAHRSALDDCRRALLLAQSGTMTTDELLTALWRQSLRGDQWADAVALVSRLPTDGTAAPTLERAVAALDAVVKRAARR